MEVYEIIIDFEALSRRHNVLSKKIHKAQPEIPYCYSIGFEGLTSFHFINPNILSQHTELKKSLLKNIQKLINVNVELHQIIFSGWNPNLEKFIFKQFYKIDNKVINFINKFNNEENQELFLNNRKYSLDQLTNNMFKSKYFEYSKSLIIENIENEKILEAAKASGSIASIMGYILWVKKNNYTSKLINFEVDTKKIQEEIKKYSLDDIKKIIWMQDNQNETIERIKKLNSIKLMEKEAVNWGRITRVLDKIEDKKMTVEQAIEFYNKKTESLNEEAESLREEHSFIK